MKRKIKYHDNYDEDFLSTSSITDMTGLIPSAPTDDEEIEHYKELYPFLPQITESTESVKVTFRDCNRPPSSLASSDYDSSPSQKKEED